MHHLTTLRSRRNPSLQPLLSFVPPHRHTYFPLILPPSPVSSPPFQNTTSGSHFCISKCLIIIAFYYIIDILVLSITTIRIIFCDLRITIHFIIRCGALLLIVIFFFSVSVEFFSPLPYSLPIVVITIEEEAEYWPKDPTTGWSKPEEVAFVYCLLEKWVLPRDFSNRRSSVVAVKNGCWLGCIGSCFSRRWIPFVSR